MAESVLQWCLIGGAGFAAGTINAIAGGGSFLTFPSLVFAGLPAVVANASNTVALVPGAASSGIAYREDIRSLHERDLKWWFAVSLLGGIIGAWLLLVTSDRTFRKIAPWLLLFATVLFAFGTQISVALRGRLHGNRAVMLVLLLPIAIYGGYFGGGIGIMILAAFRLYGLSDIHAMNGIKTLLSVTLNAVAALMFIFAHDVWWTQTLVMMAAGIVGGYSGPFLAKRLGARSIRWIVICVGVLMTIYFFHISPH